MAASPSSGGEGRLVPPLPLLEGLTAEFYRWCRQGELRFQRCLTCWRWRHVPREACPHCGSLKWQWAPSKGRGRLFTWTVVARPMHPAFARDLPYVVAIVELEEGVRMVTRLVDCPPENLHVDMPVEVTFVEVDGGVALPYFRPAS